MLRRLEASHDNVIGYSLGGEVTDDEYRQAASQLRDEVAIHGRIRLLFRLSDLSLQSFFRALDERFRFVKEHVDDIDRVAVVSDDKATEWLSKLSDVTGAVETQHFSMDDEDKAWAWLE